MHLGSSARYTYLTVPCARAGLEKKLRNGPMAMPASRNGTLRPSASGCRQGTQGRSRQVLDRGDRENGCQY